jgi:hypothetical protein
MFSEKKWNEQAALAHIMLKSGIALTPRAEWVKENPSALFP